jgi:hypothetical protein
MTCGKEARLSLRLAENLLQNLSLVVQNGFFLKIRRGCSLDAFLTEQIGLSREYIEERIQTVFLDGKPVDDLEASVIRDGSSLALSAAMPGLVGAAMRRGGFYGRLRSTITYRHTNDPGMAGEGLVHMKIFNLLMHELGPGLLRKGIFVPSNDLAGFLERQTEAFWAGCSVIALNGEAATRDTLLRQGGLSRYDTIHLNVETEP